MGTVIKVSIIIACLAAAVFMFARQSSTPVDPSALEVEVYKCTVDGKEFDVTVAQVRASAKAGSPAVKCPQCATTKTIQVFRCTACQKTFEPVGHGTKPDKCPHCGAATASGKG